MITLDRVFELIAEHTSDLICIHDAENTIRFATPSSRNILGYQPDQIIGKKLTDFLSDEFINEMDFTTLVRFFDHPGARIRYQIKHAEKKLRWLESTFTTIGSDPLKEYSVLSSTRDITESVHLTDDLMNALAKEQELSRFKSNLYSIASHEFKTPLAVIQANIEMLKVKNSETILKKSLQSMEEEIDHLNGMIADMLELKRLTIGQINFNPSELDIWQLIKDVIDTDCKKAYSDIAITIDHQDEDIREVSGDYSLLRYIFSNLLINACKFSNKSKEVKVQLSRIDENNLGACVIDKGIGIPEEDQDSVFKSFYRANNVGNIPGTGVGLSIVKEFVALHKGSINFTSAPGKGSTFCVELPIKQVKS